jgi:hypothetical protein
VGNLTQFECLVELVELWKDEFAVAVVLGDCGLIAPAFAAALLQSPDVINGCAATGCSVQS